MVQTLSFGPLIAILMALQLMAFGDRLYGAPLANLIISNLYVHDGDVLDVLPQLVIQCQVHALLDLGKLEPLQEPPVGSYRQLVDIPVIPPSRMTIGIEWKEGRLGDLLDAFCKLNPRISWSEQRNCILITRKSNGREAIDAIMKHRIGSFRYGPSEFRFLGADLEEFMAEAVKKLPDSERAVISDMNPPDRLPDYRPYHTMIDRSETINFFLDQPTIQDVLIESLSRTRFDFWIAYLGREEEGVNKQDQIELLASNWHPKIREWSDQELVELLIPEMNGNEGFSSIRRRILAVGEELRRRGHFGASFVSSVFTPFKQGRVFNRICEANGGIWSENAIRELISLNDPTMTIKLMDYVLMLKDEPKPDVLSLRTRLFSEMPSPHDPTYTVVRDTYRQIAKSEDEKALKIIAQSILELEILYERDSPK